VTEESQFLQVNGIRMHVVSAGQGPPILLLHGFPDTHDVWRKQVGVLAAAGFRVIAPDLRGYGQTEAPPHVHDYAMKLLCADVLALLDALGIDKVRLVGHDWGAAIGWQLSTHAPERIERFVALSVGHPAALAHAGLGQQLRLSYVIGFLMPGLAEHTLKFSNWLFVRKFTRDRTQIGYWRRSLRPPGRLTAALNYYRANILLGLSRHRPADAGRVPVAVQVPVMGVWSDGDLMLGERQMRESERFVQGGFRFERIDGADHWLQLTAPDKLNALLLDYFGSPYSAAA
jgi:pimeloyl-ACP methyl ester carboxylesterase